jgi:16S rRNA (cytidine1402-2'-O)-methyltransferase
MSQHTTDHYLGTLYLVGTPIGNLEDISLRALRTLQEVAVIAAEDTRVTRKLLQRHHIITPLLSYHEHSRHRRQQELVAVLQSGKSVALVSDAGMPGISDPGADLVRAARDAGVPVAVVPGPTAVSSALALSGIPGQQYLFLGFLPTRQSARRKALQQVASWTGPIVCFEAPHRLRNALDDIASLLGDRQAAVARELTKRFEETVQGSVSDLITHFADHEPRGEITIILAPALGQAPSVRAQSRTSLPTVAQASSLRTGDALQEVQDLISAGLSPSRAVAHVSKHRGLRRRELYQSYLAAVGHASSVPDEARLR